LGSHKEILISTSDLIDINTEEEYSDFGKVSRPDTVNALNIQDHEYSKDNLLEKQEVFCFNCLIRLINPVLF
jgi:hypothetical protein